MVEFGQLLRMEDNMPMEVNPISCIVLIFLPVHLLLYWYEDRPLFSCLMLIISSLLSQFFLVSVKSIILIIVPGIGLLI